MLSKSKSKVMGRVLSFSMIFSAVAPNSLVWADYNRELKVSEGESLIISEYAHLGKGTKAIELYNASNKSISLGKYNIASYEDGDKKPVVAYELENNVINPGDTYVIASADSENDEFNTKISELVKEGKACETDSQIFTSDKSDLLVLREEQSNGDHKEIDSFEIKEEKNDKINTSNVDSLGVHQNSEETTEEALPEEYISIAEARGLETGAEVKISGVVSFNDRDKEVHIQDSTGAISVSNYDSKIDLSGAKNGMEIKVTGKLKPFNNLLQVQATEVEVVKEAGMPEAVEKTIKELKETNHDSLYVEIKGAELDLGKKILKQGDDVLDIYFIPSGLEVKTGDIVDVKATMGRYKDTVQIYGSSATFTKVEVETPQPDPDPQPTPSKGPSINKYSPGSNLVLESGSKPVIEVHYSDTNKIDTSSVKMYLDSKEITSGLEITSEYVKYPVKTSLKDGSHNVKVEVSNEEGTQTVHEWTFRVGKLQHLVGQLHSHTNISDGSGTLEEAYEWAKEKGNADYYAVTDHSNWFDNDTKASILDGSASTAWTKAQSVADEYDKASDFSAIYGYEMTWSGSTGGWGHINTFNTPGFETRSNSSMDLKTYYENLNNVKSSVSQLNHPGKTFGDFGDFGFYSSTTDKLVNLIEVGNGEGPVRGSGYFPSYEYYTRALDKGWHVAPTNNQDNHKKGWMTANDARTVIIAPENTKEALYQSMRDKMVYSTEDKNMTIDYKVNNQMMGATLDSDVKKLNVSIKVDDPDADDVIGKISIISNGGVEVASKNFNSNTATWNLELDPQYTYYYVKVEQKDKDILVSSPVWVGESFNAGFNEPSVDKSIPLKGEDLTAKFEFYNNNENKLENIKLEFFNNSISDDNKIKEEVIDEILPGNSVGSEITFVPENLGDQVVWARATLNYEGTEKVFTKSIKFNVKDPASVSRVMIDGSKGNQYVTGHYAGNVNGLIDEFAKRDCLAEINEDPITKESLNNVELLIITDPEGKSEKKGNYSAEELAAIKDYVESGRDIIVSTRADYGDAKGEYSNSAQVNPILETIGSKLRVNDDQVTDNENNEGQPYRLMFNTYESPNYNLVKGLTKTDLYSFYSGASVVLADGATSEGVDYLVKGHTTTESVNQDRDNDFVPVEKGNVAVLAAEELDNGAKVVVSGNTFLSDFEIDGENQKQKSNMKVLSQIFDWALPQKEIQKLSIAEFRKDEDKDGTPDLMGQEFILEGTVTAQSEAVEPKNAFFECIYIQDETGGINVFGVSQTPLKAGQKVRIKGTVGAYEGETQIAIQNELEDLEIIDESINEIAPTKMTTGDSMLAENQGVLTEVVGTVTRMDREKGNVYVNDGSGEARVYLNGYIGDGVTDESKGKFAEDIEVGSKVSAIGLASEDSEGNRLRVRNTSEVKVVEDDEDDDTTDKPGTDDEDDDTTDKPGTDDEDNDSTDKPGTDDEDNDSTDKPGTDDEEDDSTDKPGTGDEDDDTADKPGTDEEEDNSTDKPGIGDEEDDSTDKPGTDSDKDEDSNDAPQTGDAGILLSSIMLIGCSVGVIGLNRKRK